MPTFLSPDPQSGPLKRLKSPHPQQNHPWTCAPQPLSSRPPFLRSVWGVTLMSAQRLGSRAGHLVSHPSPGPPREQLHNDHLRSAPMVWTVPAVPGSVLEGLNSIQENTFKALDQLHKRTSVTFLQPHRTTGKEEAWGWAGCHGC